MLKTVITALALSVFIVPVALAKDHDKGERHEGVRSEHHERGERGEHHRHHGDGFWRSGIWVWGPDCYVFRNGIRILICD